MVMFTRILVAFTLALAVLAVPQASGSSCAADSAAACCSSVVQASPYPPYSPYRLCVTDASCLQSDTVVGGLLATLLTLLGLDAILAGLLPGLLFGVDCSSVSLPLVEGACGSSNAVCCANLNVVSIPAPFRLVRRPVRWTNAIL